MFTARYGLISYIKQISFVFKGLMADSDVIGFVLVFLNRFGGVNFNISAIKVWSFRAIFS